MKTIINNIYPAFAAFALCCFAVLPKAQAVNPPPDGGYANFTTAEGENALFNLSTGVANTAAGWSSLKSDTTGSFNTGVGAGALLLNNGDSNTAVGAVALLLNTTGTQNTAVGTDAMVYNDTGNFNTAVGAFALFSNTTAIENTATGWVALYNANGTGSFNTATGSQALNGNTTGDFNTATGHTALKSNTIGYQNTANGSQTLFSNTEGYSNVASGFKGLNSNTTGYYNMASGANALQHNTEGIGNTGSGNAALLANTTGLQNTACGNAALFETTTGFLNTALGMAAGDFTAGDNNILVGNLGVAMESNTIRIGMEVGANDQFGIPHPAHTATYIAGISGQTATNGVAVFIDSDGKLGTLTSSGRFKTEIKPMNESSEAILALKPVTFRYKHEIDPNGIPQFGLVAEEVEKVNPDLVSRDRDGKPYTVRYEAVNAMLLNEFLKEHRTVQELKSTVATHEAMISQQKKEFQASVAQQQKEIKALTASLKEQASQIQRVSAQLELSRPAPQTASLPAVVPRLRDEGGNNQ